MEKPFSYQEADLIPGDMLYLFSDGFADQFGGPENKKIRTKGLTDLLLSIAHLPSEEQHVAIAQNFLEWMGNNEQMDDVSLMGIRVPRV
jgi:serine phosphatase RsbU (regulator of sigma subunit)